MCTFTVLNSIIYQTFRESFTTKIESIPFAYNFRKMNFRFLILGIIASNGKINFLLKKTSKTDLVLATMEPSLNWDRAMMKRGRGPRAGRRAKLLAQMNAEFGR